MVRQFFAEIPTGFVFARDYSPPVTLIGLASGTIPDGSGGKLGMVVPVRYLRELLSSSEIEAYERDNPLQ